MEATTAPPQIHETGPLNVETSEQEGLGVSEIMMLRSQLVAASQIEETDQGINGTVTIAGQRLGGADEGVLIRAVQHRRSRRIRLYKPYPTCQPAVIPAENFDGAIADGWQTRCPECHTDCGGSPWGCGKAPEPMYLRCEVCNRKFWYMVRVTEEAVADDSPLHVKNPFLDEAGGTVPAEMTARSDYLAHMGAYHKQVALAMKLPGITEAS